MDGAPSQATLFPDDSTGSWPPLSLAALTPHATASESLPLLLPVEGNQLLAALYPALGVSAGTLVHGGGDDLSEPSPFRHVLSDEGKSQVKTSSYDGDEPLQCPITMRDIHIGSPVATLPCGHQFSPKGLRTWLEKYDAKCPVCRYELPSREARVDSPPPPQPLQASAPPSESEPPELTYLVRSLARLTLAQGRERTQTRVMRSLFDTARHLS